MSRERTAKKTKTNNKPKAEPAVTVTETREAAHYPWLALPTPTVRPLQVYAQDPSGGRYSGNLMTLEVPWEPLTPGPRGRKVAVIDYDASNKAYYPPVNLDDPRLLTRRGLDPSESDPRFHQQMVYAVASHTIEMFEVALGREIHWRRADRFGDTSAEEEHWRKTDDIGVLNLYPHAMQQANAFYSPQAHGILFGYFTANQSDQGRNLPGQRVFTCLSHDIVAHEVTHAIIDGIRTYFTEPTNPDVLAFHEGFADLCALFSHFSQEDALRAAISRTGGRLYDAELAPVGLPWMRPPRKSNRDKADPENKGGTPLSSQLPESNPLIELAQQFGEARGMGRGLRSALGTWPNSDDINKRVDDPHFRGSIFVAAVFDAYFSVYLSRADNLFRIYGAGGATRTDDLPAPLSEHLARNASETATFFFQLCARALDYCPPVDLTFGDFLRALITVATDMPSRGYEGVCAALMQAFRLRGIYPESATFFSEDALAWPRVVEGTIPPVGQVRVAHPKTGDIQKMDLAFGNPNGLTTLEKDINGRVLRAWALKNREALGLDPSLPIAVPSFHPVFRTTRSGRTRVEMIVEVIQAKSVHFDSVVPEAGTFPFRGGATLIIEAPEVDSSAGRGSVASLPKVRFVIGKAIHGDEGSRRQAVQRDFAFTLGLASGDVTEANHFQANFGLIHEER